MFSGPFPLFTDVLFLPYSKTADYQVSQSSNQAKFGDFPSCLLYLKGVTLSSSQFVVQMLQLLNMYFSTHTRVIRNIYINSVVTDTSFAPKKSCLNYTAVPTCCRALGCGRGQLAREFFTFRKGSKQLQTAPFKICYCHEPRTHFLLCPGTRHHVLEQPRACTAACQTNRTRKPTRCKVTTVNPDSHRNTGH